MILELLKRDFLGFLALHLSTYREQRLPTTPELLRGTYERLENLGSVGMGPDKQIAKPESQAVLCKAEIPSHIKETKEKQVA